MPETIGLLIIEAVAPELAAAAAAPLSIGGLSLGVSAASVLGTGVILGAPVGQYYVLTPSTDEDPIL